MQEKCLEHFEYLAGSTSGLTSMRRRTLTGAHPSFRWFPLPLEIVNITTAASWARRLVPNFTESGEIVMLCPSTSTTGKDEVLGGMESSNRPVAYERESTMKSKTSGSWNVLARVAHCRKPEIAFSII